MKVVVQRVTSASVTISGNLRSDIGKGLLVLLGIESSDSDDDIEWLTNKIIDTKEKE